MGSGRLVPPFAPEAFPASPVALAGLPEDEGLEWAQRCHLTGFAVVFVLVCPCACVCARVYMCMRARGRSCGFVRHGPQCRRS